MCFGNDARPPLPPVRGGSGTEAEVHVYPDAVHSFFDRRYDQYREECDDAWRRLLEFMARRGAT